MPYHAFSALSLSGFSTHDTSVGYFHSPLVEAVLIVFMLIAAMNFATIFCTPQGQPATYRRDPEAKWRWCGSV
jgi:trk system potassium uptake protein TrkH